MSDFVATDEDVATLRLALWDEILFEYPTIRDFSERINFMQPTTDRADTQLR